MNENNYICYFYCFIVILDLWLNEVILYVFIELSFWKFVEVIVYRRCGGDKKIIYNYKCGVYYLFRNLFLLM